MKSEKLTVGILGIGQVGSAIAQLVKPKHKLLLKDIDKDEIKSQKLDVLHICLPYSNNFHHLSLNLVKKTQPQLVIIESTVPLKTSEKLALQTNSLVVHSPIRGIHPHLAKYIKQFVKFIGPTSAKAGNLAKQYYTGLDLKVKLLNSSQETELGKLLSTTYYALCIAWHQEMARFCKKYQIDFDQAVTQFNQTYNQGYQKSKPNVIRPVLNPGFIGGHCLMPNIGLLSKNFQSDFLQAIVRSNSIRSNKKIK